MSDYLGDYHRDEITMLKYGDETHYYVTLQIGGKDEQGEYLLVMEGPAQGEKVYL